MVSSIQFTETEELPHLDPLGLVDNTGKSVGVGAGGVVFGVPVGKVTTQTRV